MPGYSGLGWTQGAAGYTTAAGVDVGALAVLKELRAAATLSRLLIGGVLLATTAFVNVFGMGDASANWVAIAARLDAGVKLPLTDALTQARSEWIAEDRQAFDTAVAKFQGDTEATRKFFEQIEKCLDDIGDAYRDYWFELAIIAGAVITAILSAFLMLFTPLAPSGKALLEWLGALATGIISTITSKLGAFLALVGGTMLTGAKGMVQLFNIKPTGSAAINFKQNTINWTAPGTWIEPKKATPAPYGT